MIDFFFIRFSAGRDLGAPKADNKVFVVLFAIRELSVAILCRMRYCGKAAGLKPGGVGHRAEIWPKYTIFRSLTASWPGQNE